MGKDNRVAVWPKCIQGSKVRTWLVCKRATASRQWIAANNEARGWKWGALARLSLSNQFSKLQRQFQSGADEAARESPSSTPNPRISRFY